MDQFKVGDVVRLKSGGPSMTVTNVSSDREDGPHANTAWFDQSKEGKGFYPFAALELAVSEMTDEQLTAERERLLAKHEAARGE